MTFYLQYRDGPSDEPIIEFRSPLPLPVPRVGEHVELFDEGSTKKASGKVEAVHWAYRPRFADEGESEGLDISARVWLIQP